MPLPVLGAAAITGATSLLGKIFGGGGGSKQQKQILNSIASMLPNALTTLQGDAEKSGRVSDEYRGRSYDIIDQAKQLIQSGLGNIDLGGDYLNSSAGYFKNILAGGAGVDAILGPQRDAISENYQNTLNSIARSGQRGGGSLLAATNFEFAKNKDLMDLVPQARQQAAEGLANTGGQLANVGNLRSSVGQSLGNLGIQTGNLGLGYQQSANQAAGTIAGLAGTGGQIAGQRAASGSALGEEIGGLIGPILGDIFGGSSSSSGNTRPRRVNG